jgi:hypothetical protein
MTGFESFGDQPFTTAMARECGIDHKRLDRGLRDREVRRLLRGVYVRADIDASPSVLGQAAALVVPPGSVLVDRTAAWVLGVDCLDYRELDVVPPVESCALRGVRATDRPECRGGSRDLLPSDWLVIGGVRVTTPIRTAMDLGCSLHRRRALAAMDALMRSYGFSQGDLGRELPRYFRRRGVLQLRRLVPLVDGRSESHGESWTRMELADHGLPPPSLQHWIHVAGIPTYRLDLAYPRARVAIEYDGEEFHSSLQDIAADEKRRAWLRAHGWTVIVLTKGSFTEDAVIAWIGEVRRALARR